MILISKVKVWAFVGSATKKRHGWWTAKWWPFCKSWWFVPNDWYNWWFVDDLTCDDFFTTGKIWCMNTPWFFVGQFISRRSKNVVSRQLSVVSPVMIHRGWSLDNSRINSNDTKRQVSDGVMERWFFHNFQVVESENKTGRLQTKHPFFRSKKSTWMILNVTKRGCYQQKKVSPKGMATEPTICGFFQWMQKIEPIDP